MGMGFAKTFPQLIIARCLNGALNGNVVVIKSMLGELSDPTNQAVGTFVAVYVA